MTTDVALSTDTDELERVVKLFELNDKQKDCLEQFLKAISPESNNLWAASLDKWLFGESRPRLAQRFCRARNFNLKKALKMLMDDLAWRDQQKVCELRDMEPSSLVQCDVSELTTRLPVLQHGRDRHERPVIYKQFGATCQVSELLKVTTQESLVRYHVWQNEQAVKSITATEQRDHFVPTCANPHSPPGMMIVIDAEGWHVGLASRAAFGFLRQIAQVDSDHYPERLGRLVVINAPSALTTAWWVIRGWLDDRTKNKIAIFGAQNEWLQTLVDEIGEEALPVMYGGKADVTY